MNAMLSKGYNGKISDVATNISQRHRTSITRFLSKSTYNEDHLQRSLKSLVLELIWYRARKTRNQMSAPDVSEDCDKILSHLYPKAVNESIELVGYEEKLQRLKNLKVKIDELDIEKKELEQHIKVAMEDKEITFIGGEKVTWKSSTTSRMDTKKFKVDYPELYGQYVKESSIRKFCIR